MRINDTRPPFARISGRDAEALFGSLPTPCYVIDKEKIIENCNILGGVSRRTGAKILLAQKAFSNFGLYPAMAPFLAGTEASGLFEARLGREEMPSGEVHVFCAAYSEAELKQILKYADHIVFNSPSQLKKFGAAAKKAGKSVGLRINPECSTQRGHAVYDPCAPGSRLGVTRAALDRELSTDELALLDGLHFHTLCEQDSADLETTLCAVYEKFGDLLPGMKWLNMGGGHHITRPGYDIPRLERLVTEAKTRFGVQVYLEPGEACALNAGFLLARVLDVTKNGRTTNVIIDASAACHMPDVLEMPYTPPLFGAEAGKRGKNARRIGGPTCLAGDVIGDYSFEYPPAEGDLLVFGDMAIYTTCKNNTFNGMPLPAIWVWENGGFKKLASFGYNDFKQRLGNAKK
ncbi:MAG: carboxynorspermidine decarboxylase [Clostridia bacterium]|nr:carboxynorspermidine decarboxylase [Clostridia bacterium]